MYVCVLCNAEGGCKFKVHLPCPVVGCNVAAPLRSLTEFAVEGIVNNKNYVTTEFFNKLRKQIRSGFLS